MAIEFDAAEWWQWDVGRTVAADDYERVHLANPGDATAYVVEVADGVAEVPDELLQTGKPVICYAIDGDYNVAEQARVRVRPRPQPEDYIYEATGYMTLAEINDAVADAIAEAEEAAASAVATAEEAASTANSASKTAYAAANQALSAATDCGCSDNLAILASKVADLLDEYLYLDGGIHCPATRAAYSDEGLEFGDESYCTDDEVVLVS